MILRFFYVIVTNKDLLCVLFLNMQVLHQLYSSNCHQISYTTVVNFDFGRGHPVLNSDPDLILDQMVAFCSL